MTKSSNKKLRIISIVWLMLAAWLALVLLQVIPIYPYVNNAGYVELYSPGTTESSGINKWNQVANIYNKEELDSALLLSANEMGSTSFTDDAQKFLSIGNWMQRSLAGNPRQQPSSSFSQLPVLTQFQHATQKPEPIWCGNFANFALLFFSANGLTTRYIEIVGGASQHVLTETYIPEWQQWVVTDFMYNVMLARIDSARYLNVADLLHLFNSNPAHYIEIAQLDSLGNLAWRKIPISTWAYYFSQHTQLLYFHTLDTKKAYHVSEKIKRYIYPAVWYDTYSLKPVSNAGYFLRLISIYFFLMLSLAFLIVFFHDRSKKYS